MDEDKNLFGEKKETQIEAEGGERSNSGAGGSDPLDDFEETFERLKGIVDNLEREDIKLGEMVTLFEEGVGLIKKCDKYLKDARTRVEAYIERDDDGRWIIKGLGED